MTRVAVVGAGVIGLAAAWRLCRKGLEVTVFDATDRCGGRVASAEFSGRLVDTGPDALGPGPAIEELLEQIGMQDQIEVPDPAQAFRLTASGALEPFSLGDGAMFGLAGGIFTLPPRLEAALEEGGADFRLGTPVESVDGREDQVLLRCETEESFDFVVIATGARAAATVIQGSASRKLAGIDGVSVTLVHLAIPTGQIGREMNGTGYLADPAEGRVVTGCSWSSAKWKRLAGEPAILRASIRETGQGEVIRTRDADIVARVMVELGPVMELEGEPVETMVTRHPAALVVRGEEHAARVRAARDALGRRTRIALVGADLDGPGISRSIGGLRQTVDAIIEGN